jgi:acyl-CoA dehydrogenase
VEFIVTDCLYKSQIAIDGLLSNYPSVVERKLLSLIIFPLGRPYKAVKDKLFKKLTSSMIVPSELRDRLTQYCYLDKDETSAQALHEKAFQELPHFVKIEEKIIAAQSQGVISKQMNQNEKAQRLQEQHILTADEISQWQAFNALRQEVCKVNEFSFDLTTVIT